MRVFPGRVEDGKIVPDGDVSLREGATVTVIADGPEEYDERDVRPALHVLPAPHVQPTEPRVEDLIPTLTRFHLEIVVPDMERIVAASEHRLRDDMHTLLDNVAVELKDLRQLYAMLSFAVKRVEERLESIEQGLEKVALRSELLELKARLDDLQGHVRMLEARLEHRERRRFAEQLEEVPTPVFAREMAHAIRVP